MPPSSGRCRQGRPSASAERSTPGMRSARCVPPRPTSSSSVTGAVPEAIAIATGVGGEAFEGRRVSVGGSVVGGSDVARGRPCRVRRRRHGPDPDRRDAGRARRSSVDGRDARHCRGIARPARQQRDRHDRLSPIRHRGDRPGDRSPRRRHPRRPRRPRRPPRPAPTPDPFAESNALADPVAIRDSDARRRGHHASPALGPGPSARP